MQRKVRVILSHFLFSSVVHNIQKTLQKRTNGSVYTNQQHQLGLYHLRQQGRGVTYLKYPAWKHKVIQELDSLLIGKNSKHMKTWLVRRNKLHSIYLLSLPALLYCSWTFSSGKSILMYISTRTHLQPEVVKSRVFFTTWFCCLQALNLLKSKKNKIKMTGGKNFQHSTQRKSPIKSLQTLWLRTSQNRIITTFK